MKQFSEKEVLSILNYASQHYDVDNGIGFWVDTVTSEDNITSRDVLNRYLDFKGIKSLSEDEGDKALKWFINLDYSHGIQLTLEHAKREGMIDINKEWSEKDLINLYRFNLTRNN